MTNSWHAKCSFVDGVNRMFPGPLRRSQRSEEGRLRESEKVKEEGGRARLEGDLMMLDWTILYFCS